MKPTRNPLLSVSSITALAVFLALGQAPAETSGYRLSWTDDPTTTMTIGWMDDENDGGPDYIKFGPKGSDEAFWDRVEITEAIPYNNLIHSGDADDPGYTNDPFTSNFVHLTELDPNSDYAFKVYNGDDVASELMWFRTAPYAPSTFTFVAGGDSRSNNDPREWGNLLIAAIRPLFVAHNGDYLDDGTNAEWREWLDEWSTLTRSEDGRMYPIVPAHGNHENDLVDMIFRIFYVRDVDGGTNAFNALSIGFDQLRIYTLNTEIHERTGYSAVGDYIDQVGNSVFDRQAEWFVDDLEANSNFTWKFASYHRPMRPHTVNKAEQTQQIEAWASAMYDYGMDLVIESDTHMVKYTYPLKPQLDDEAAEVGTYESFVRADDDPNAILFAGEGSWGAPRRPQDDNKAWTMAADSLWQFKLVTVIADDLGTFETDESCLELRTVMFDEFSQVENVTPLSQAEQDEVPDMLPEGLSIWAPVTGDTLKLPFDVANLDAVHLPLVGAGDEWSYFNEATGPDADGFGNTWVDVDYAEEAANWQTGFAQFGYGDGDETTVLSFGGDSQNKWPVYYFRKAVEIADASAAIHAVGRITYDDGAVVYVNGVEVFRTDSMGDGAVSETTFAAGNSERTFEAFYIPGDLFQAGENVIAVSVHQDSPGSSDTSFDLYLNLLVGQTGIAAAATPTGLEASDGDSLDTVTVSWDEVPGAVGYMLEARLSGSPKWELLEATLEDPKDPSGGDAGDDGYFKPFFVENGIVTYELNQLPDSTVWDFRVRAYNSGGLSAPTEPESGSTSSNPLQDLFFEDFEDESFENSNGNILLVETQGDHPWYINPNVGRLSIFANASAFEGPDGLADDPQESWMILPTLPSFFYADFGLSFLTITNFADFGPDNIQGTEDDVFGLDVLVSDDYDPNDPEMVANPNLATWTSVFDRAEKDEDQTGWGDWVFSGVVDLSDLLGGKTTIAFRYNSSGTTFDHSPNWEVDDVNVTFTGPGVDFEGEGLINEAFWTVYNLGSVGGPDDDWHYQNVGGQVAAVNNNFGEDVQEVEPGDGIEADDYLVSDPFYVSDPQSALTFRYYQRYGDDANPEPLAVLVTDDFTGDPETTVWKNITPEGLKGSVDNAWIGAVSEPFEMTGSEIVVAFHYTSTGNGSGTTLRVGVDEVSVRVLGDLEVDFNVVQLGGLVRFVPQIIGGLPPFEYLWEFGDGTTSSLEEPTHLYAGPGPYNVTLTITGGDETEISTTIEQAVTAFNVIGEPVNEAEIRIATFNVESRRENEGQLAADLPGGNDEQYRQVAEVIQTIRPDILLINEFDHDSGNVAVEALIDDYLSISQNGLAPIDYPYYFNPPSNTGLQPDAINPAWQYDLDNGYDGRGAGNPVDFAADAFGFGEWGGRYGFVILSRYPIDEEGIRTFQKFLWKDMPDALQPRDPDDRDGNGDTDYWYTEEEWSIFRLSSKNHVDVPVIIDEGKVIHVLASHPTPPVFDDGTDVLAGNPPQPVGNEADWNGARNHDEIRFWSDYVSGAAYIYDDGEYDAAQLDNPVEVGEGLFVDFPDTPAEPSGGLEENVPFVIMGDLNADEDEGDSTGNPIGKFITDNPLIDNSFAPLGRQNQTNSKDDTNATAGGIRIDYALPSVQRIDVVNSGVFWPDANDRDFYLTQPSDHYLVYIDVNIESDVIDPTDSDDDGIPDVIEEAVIDADPNDDVETLADVTPEGDFDDDGLTNIEEVEAGTSLILFDTDGDLFGDADEVDFGSDPLSPESMAVAQELMTAMEFRFNTFPGLTYQVQYSANLVDWFDIGEPIEGSGTVESVFISFEGREKSQEHYRLMVIAD